MRDQKSEIVITENSERTNLKNILKILIDKVGVKFVDESDVTSDYLNYVDTLYYDFEYSKVKFTIHLEHYTGIIIYTNSKKPNERELTLLKELKAKIKQFF